MPVQSLGCQLVDVAGPHAGWTTERTMERLRVSYMASNILLKVSTRGSLGTSNSFANGDGMLSLRGRIRARKATFRYGCRVCAGGTITNRNRRGAPACPKKRGASSTSFIRTPL
jgi:hypothetical protein